MGNPSGSPTLRQRSSSDLFTTARSRRAIGEPMTTTTRAKTGKLEHLHDRPTWDCRVCRRPWPCASAKANLLEEFRSFPSVLTVYLSGQMYDALGDLTSPGEPPPADLYERFLSWARVNR